MVGQESQHSRGFGRRLFKMSGILENPGATPTVSSTRRTRFQVTRSFLTGSVVRT